MQQSLQSKIISLYRSESLSAREISERLCVTMRAVYYQLDRAGIERRSATEHNRIRFQRKPLSYSWKGSLDNREVQLMTMALSLYWCEGFQSKTATGIDFANSNPLMIQVFCSFLRTICRVDGRRLRCYLYCYSNQNAGRLIRYWSTVSGIPRDQFTKPYIRSDFRLDKIDKMPYGLIHIRYSDKKLLIDVKNRIEKLAHTIMGGYQSGQMGLTVIRQLS